KRWGAANSPSLFRHRRSRLTPGMPPCSQLYKDEPLRAHCASLTATRHRPEREDGLRRTEQKDGTKGQKSLFPFPGRMHGTLDSKSRSAYIDKHTSISVPCSSSTATEQPRHPASPPRAFAMSVAWAMASAIPTKSSPRSSLKVLPLAMWKKYRGILRTSK